VLSGAGVSFVERLIQVPLVHPAATDTEWVVATLIWPSDVAIEGD
jgi:hypothetical protein